MKAKLKKLVLMLTITTVLLSLATTNMQIVSSEGFGGKIDIFTHKEPYGGKGPNTSSDALGPGEEVQVYASATYNEEPVQNILVAFEILGPPNPFGNITFFRTAFTNESGIAAISFRISHLNETTFGEWKVIGNARIVDSVCNDSVTFRVGWIVEIASIETINESYVRQDGFLRESYVGVDLTLRSIAMIDKTVTIAVSIYDSLNILVNATELKDFRVPSQATVHAYLFLYIPKTSHIGSATVHACVYTTSVEFGGIPYCPEISKDFFIGELLYFLTIKTEPIGIITIAGEGWYEKNTNVSLTAPSALLISDGVRYKFSYWDIDEISQGVEVNVINVFMNANHTATAHYVLQYYLTVKTDPSEITTISGEGWYDAFTNVTLSAPTVYGYNFGYWDVDDVSQGEGLNPIVVYMNAPHNATAHYTVITAPTGWFVPEWFWWFLLFLILILLLLLIWLYLRRKRKKGEEAFRSGWTAWYYCYDLRKTHKI